MDDSFDLMRFVLKIQDELTLVSTVKGNDKQDLAE